MIHLSAAWLHCVSAGGAYCANSARARAAFLGLKFPGAYGAPDLSGPPPYPALYPQASHHHQFFQNNPQPPATDYNLLYNLPKEFPHFQPAGHGGLVQTNPLRLSGLSGGEPLNNRQLNFAQVKRVVGPLMQTRPPGQTDFEDWASESHRKKLQFASNGRDAAADAIVPNRPGMSGLSGHFQPLSRSYSFYHMPYPVGAKPGVVYPAMGTRGRPLRGHSAWPGYGRVNNMPTHPFYHFRKHYH